MEVSPLTIFSPDGDSRDESAGLSLHDDVSEHPVEQLLFAATASAEPNDDDLSTIHAYNDNENGDSGGSVVAANDDDDDNSVLDDDDDAVEAASPPDVEPLQSATIETMEQQRQPDERNASSSSSHDPGDLNSSDMASSELGVLLLSSSSTGNDGVAAAAASSSEANHSVEKCNSGEQDDDDDEERDSAAAAVAGLCRFQGEEQVPVLPLSADDDDDKDDHESAASSVAILEDDVDPIKSETESDAVSSPEIAERVQRDARTEAFDERSVGFVDPEGSPDSGFSSGATNDECYAADADYEQEVINAYSSVSDNEPMDDERAQAKTLRIDEECPLLHSALEDFNKENLQSPALSISKTNKSTSFLDNAETNGLDATEFEKDVIDAYSGIKDDEPSDEEVRKVRLSIEEECPHLQSALDELGAFDWRQEMLSPVLKPPARRRADVTDLPEELRRSGSAGAHAHAPQRGSSPLPHAMFSPFRSDRSYSREIDLAKEDALATPAGDRSDQESPFRNDCRDGQSEEVVEAAATPEDENLLSDNVQDDYSPLFDYSTQMVSPPVRSRRRRRRETVLPVPIRDESSDNDEPNTSHGLASSAGTDLKVSPAHTKEHSPDQPEQKAVKERESDDEVEEDQNASDSHEEGGSEGERSVAATNDDEKSSCSDAPSCESDADSDSETSTVVQDLEKITDPLKVDGRTVLTTLDEDKVDNLEAVDAADHRRLLVENRRLRDKLHTIRSDYDQRVTPFRDLFDERRKMRNENNRLIRETREMEERLNDVQKKAMATVHISDQKTKFLQAKLLQANQENGSVAALRTQLEEANSEIAALKDRMEG